MCWLCRVIGHKWVVKRYRSVDGLRLDEIVLFACCLRCGEPSPIPETSWDDMTADRRMIKRAHQEDAKA